MATGNQGKLAEIREILRGGELLIAPQSEFDFEPAAETGKTFLENALLKARHAVKETGLIAIADDSGLCVDALDGDPGVYTARFAGPGASDADNIDKLLQLLAEVGPQQRGARFVCMTVAVSPNDQAEPLVGSGEWRGSIATDRRGDAGFGYDPVFLDPELQISAAEMTADEKNARSHRGQAFRQLGALLSEANWF